MTITAWEKGTSGIMDADVSDLAAAMCPTWRPENPQDLIEKLCILKSVVANSGVIDFPAQPCDCFCNVDPHELDWHDRGDAFRFIAEAVRTALQVPASRRCHPTDAIHRVMADNGEVITQVILDENGWRVWGGGGWWPAEGDADDPEGQWVNVMGDEG